MTPELGRRSSDSLPITNSVATSISLVDHDLLIRLDEKMDTVVANQAIEIAERAKLEARVAQLEGFRLYVLGGATALGTIFGAAAGLLVSWLKAFVK